MSAAIGFGATPAHRGAAYAVFEQFELAEYGNRIPSLTFEIVADDAPVSAGAIAAELSDGIVDGAGATQMLGGFSAYGDSVRGVLETLAGASGGWFAPAGAPLRFTPHANGKAAGRERGGRCGGRWGGPLP